MDLLKDIRELRGGEGSTRDDGPAGRTPHSDAVDQPTTDASGGFVADDDAPSDDTHVCSFCETEFDADRRACPECDAEIVLRGER